VYAPTAKLVIVGAVHISQALAPLARSLDYDVTVVDPRTAFASPERFPDVPLVAEWPDVALPPLNIDHYTAFVAVTHDPKIDDPALLHAFERECFYIGARGSLVLKKGTTIGAAEVEALNKAGVEEAVVVRLEEGDVSEDVAAASIAEAVAGDGVHVERAFTGRSNLFAARAGVLVVDRAAVDRINAVDEAITFATLSAYKPVVEGEMIATVKLIPFGVEKRLCDAAVSAV